MECDFTLVKTGGENLVRCDELCVRKQALGEKRGGGGEGNGKKRSVGGGGEED